VDLKEKYKNGAIRALAARLAEAGVPAETSNAILAGGEGIPSSGAPERRADWMRQAMDKMDALLDTDTRNAIREGCACCLGGKRLEISRRIAAQNATLEDRIKAANESHFVFGHGVTRDPDGRITVWFEPEGREHYRCVCLPKASEPISITYCYCCGGHIKHHLQIALGCRLSCEARSSALSSGGKSPCAFTFTIEDEIG